MSPSPLARRLLDLITGIAKDPTYWPVTSRLSAAVGTRVRIGDDLASIRYVLDEQARRWVVEPARELVAFLTRDENRSVGPFDALVSPGVWRAELGVDLFVTVASITVDPRWSAPGPDLPPEHRDYWRTGSFAALPPSAEVRRDALCRLIGRTSIADRCTLTDRFLVVRGDLRTYRIHLGSANVLMEPNDAYLCIVPAGGPRDRPFPPFEEDGRLALILSEAFLLADDTAVTTPSIVRQIRA